MYTTLFVVSARVSLFLCASSYWWAHFPRPVLFLSFCFPALFQASETSSKQTTPEDTDSTSNGTIRKLGSIRTAHASKGDTYHYYLVSVSSWVMSLGMGIPCLWFEQNSARFEAISSWSSVSRLSQRVFGVHRWVLASSPPYVFAAEADRGWFLRYWKCLLINSKPEQTKQAKLHVISYAQWRSFW